MAKETLEQWKSAIIGALVSIVIALVASQFATVVSDLSAQESARQEDARRIDRLTIKLEEHMRVELNRTGEMMMDLESIINQQTSILQELSAMKGRPITSARTPAR
jgi:hypothetical protein